PKGTTQQFVATGTYSDNTTQDLSSQASWTTSSPSVATISNAAGSQGLASASGVGQTTITATVSGISGTAILTVRQAALLSINVTPTHATIAKGTNDQFTATGTYSDAST